MSEATQKRPSIRPTRTLPPAAEAFIAAAAEPIITEVPQPLTEPEDQPDAWDFGDDGDEAIAEAGIEIPPPAPRRPRKPKAQAAPAPTKAPRKPRAPRPAAPPEPAVKGVLLIVEGYLKNRREASSPIQLYLRHEADRWVKAHAIAGRGGQQIVLNYLIARGIAAVEAEATQQAGAPVIVREEG
jgi:hypothetical protein